MPTLLPRPCRASSVLAFLAELFCGERRITRHNRIDSHACGDFAPVQLDEWARERRQRRRPAAAAGPWLQRGPLCECWLRLQHPWAAQELACLGEAFFFSADLGAMLGEGLSLLGFSSTLDQAAGGGVRVRWTSVASFQAAGGSIGASMHVSLHSNQRFLEALPPLPALHQDF